MRVGMDEHEEMGPAQGKRLSEMQDREVERGRGRGEGGWEEKDKREVERGRRGRGRGKRGYRGTSYMGCRMSTEDWWLRWWTMLKDQYETRNEAQASWRATEKKNRRKSDDEQQRDGKNFSWKAWRRLKRRRM